MKIEQKLQKLGLFLPPPHEFPNPNRTGCTKVANLLFVSGHPPASVPGIKIKGKVSVDVSEEEAYSAAQYAALNILSSIKRLLGDLDEIRAVVKIFGMVNSSPGFNRQFAVIDGASDLFLKLWGPANGQHARSAVGMFELPRNIPVEIEGIFELF